MTPDVLIDLREVLRQTGFAKTHIYRLMKAGAFPGVLKSGRTSRWSQTEVTAWLESLKQKRGAAA